ncbi:MAG TPA: vitamin K epoxide reductase family protein [Candidatus Paceibacterota bacterium]|nr:vitamin K epoxide reductase family protein [Candidatus Paceibacterota bacterium]
MPFLAAFIALSLGGIVDSGYLLYTHYGKKSLVCPLDHDCSYVTESKWSRIFGARNEVLGFLFYAGVFVFALGEAAFPATVHPLYAFAVWGIGAGFLFSVFLVLVQIFAIKDYCFYCIISALLTLFLFLGVFVIPH